MLHGLVMLACVGNLSSFFGLPFPRQALELFCVTFFWSTFIIAFAEFGNKKKF
jgi:hypothetical protein